jgi:large subunit ribosomal protein L18
MEKPSRTSKRRRKEGKTDYKNRFGLLKSNKPRVVVRKSNRYLISQIVVSEEAQDKVIKSVSSKELMSFEWPENLKGSLKNLSACYLTGFLIGKKSQEIDECVLDIGLQRNIYKSRIYAFLKGLIDSGLNIKHGGKITPNEEMIKLNDKTKELVDKIKEKIENS